MLKTVELLNIFIEKKQQQQQKKIYIYTHSLATLLDTPC